MVTPAAERKAVAHLIEHYGMSERRACKTIDRCRMTIRYKSTRPDDSDLLKREGHTVNHKKLFRLYREERLTVRKRGGRKRAMGARAPMLVPLKPIASNQKVEAAFWINLMHK